MHRLSVSSFVENTEYNTFRTYQLTQRTQKADCFKQKEFIEAYKDAEKNNYVMIVHNIVGLFAPLSNDEQAIYLNKIMEGQVEIIDAALDFSLNQAGEKVVKKFINREIRKLSLKRSIAKATFKSKMGTRGEAYYASTHSKIRAREGRDRLKPDIESVLSISRTPAKCRCNSLLMNSTGGG